MLDSAVLVFARKVWLPKLVSLVTPVIYREY